MEKNGINASIMVAVEDKIDNRKANCLIASLCAHICTCRHRSYKGSTNVPSSCLSKSK